MISVLYFLVTTLEDGRSVVSKTGYGVKKTYKRASKSSLKFETPSNTGKISLFYFNAPGPTQPFVSLVFTPDPVFESPDLPLSNAVARSEICA